MRAAMTSKSLGLELPLMLVLHYSAEIGMLTVRPLSHTRWCVTFSPPAAEYCGGAADVDEDGYVVRCHDEVTFVDVVRHQLLPMLQAVASGVA